MLVLEHGSGSAAAADQYSGFARTHGDSGSWRYDDNRINTIHRFIPIIILRLGENPADASI
jgi:hypothetical protein